MPKQQNPKPFIQRYLLSLQLFLVAISLPATTLAQWTIFDIKTNVHMRAVFTLTPTICWIGGTQGTIFKTNNGGKTWTTYKVPAGDSLEFRDIHAFDRQTAIAMSAGEAQQGKARIYRTEDGGASWNLVYQSTQNGVFLDGFDFWDKKRGICAGDPVDGRLFILTTEDGGKTWKEADASARPQTLPGEACFAASGTSIITTGKSDVYIGTGGAQKARIFHSDDYGLSWKITETNMAAGPTSGIFGLRFLSKKIGIAVGGDYKNTTDSSLNVLRTTDGGETWAPEKAITKPAGLKEAVGIYRKTSATWNGDTEIRSDQFALIAVGPSGNSYSNDRGKTWRELGKQPFHSISFAGNVGYAVGSKGLIGKIDKVSTKKRKKRLVLVD
ncbi:WD40/YVTN/BNR-like repeat-containing protein [Dyadobacter helix]|uniref:WD40/YVTN/BNR-like repeat-containing protein n=1 Tax=Dyadobacter helix TaxID=2822344 RepID=UPI001E30A67A|nr:oxidoreductase [Dyadobacter sp. CECT 9275]